MNTWLKLLPLEIQEVEKLMGPQEEVRPGETSAGFISEELKKLYTLWRSLEKSAELLEVELKFKKATDEERGRLAEMRAKSHALETIFWIGVLDELQLWSHREQCAIRAGWEVVEFKSGPPDIFRHLFGLQP